MRVIIIIHNGTIYGTWA